MLVWSILMLPLGQVYRTVGVSCACRHGRSTGIAGKPLYVTLRKETEIRVT